MAKYIAVHPVGKELSVEASAPIGKAVKAQCSADAYWVRSQYLREEGKLYCEWDAKDAASIQSALDKANSLFAEAAQLPTEAIYPLDMTFSAEDFR